MPCSWITSTGTVSDCLTDPLFLCVLSNTDTCLIPKISAAGASTERNVYTPAADSEIVVYGSPRSVPELPMKPNGAPTPAVMTRAALQLTGMPYLFVNSGLRIVPEVPTIYLGAEPGLDIRYGNAVPRADAIHERAAQVGLQLGRLSGKTGRTGTIIIGESVPGGTTTALGVLTALGYDYGVSSSCKDNPLEIKRRVVEEGIIASGITVAGARADPFSAVAAVGDPMMPAVAGLVSGMTQSGCEIILAGGTQMITVATILTYLGLDTSRISIATTKYVYQDRSIDFDAVQSDLGCSIHIVDPGFLNSRMRGLQRYEAGEVKEGVGAGGAMYAAGMLGFEQKTMRERVEVVYGELMGLE